MEQDLALASALLGSSSSSEALAKSMYTLFDMNGHAHRLLQHFLFKELTDTDSEGTLYRYLVVVACALIINYYSILMIECCYLFIIMILCIFERAQKPN